MKPQYKTVTFPFNPKNPLNITKFQVDEFCQDGYLGMSYDDLFDSFNENWIILYSYIALNDIYLTGVIVLQYEQLQIKLPLAGWIEDRETYHLHIKYSFAEYTSDWYNYDGSEIDANFILTDDVINYETYDLQKLSGLLSCITKPEINKYEPDSRFNDTKLFTMVRSTIANLEPLINYWILSSPFIKPDNYEYFNYLVINFHEKEFNELTSRCGRLSNTEPLKSAYASILESGYYVRSETFDTDDFQTVSIDLYPVKNPDMKYVKILHHIKRPQTPPQSHYILENKNGTYEPYYWEVDDNMEIPDKTRDCSSSVNYWSIQKFDCETNMIIDDDKLFTLDDIDQLSFPHVLNYIAKS